MISEQQCEAIIDEVFTLLGIEDVFHLVDRSSGQRPDRMELRLQELLSSRMAYPVEALVVYLRASFSRAEYLPSWQPLLNAAIEQARMHGLNLEMFYGLMPPEQIVRRNTDGMVGSRHPQMQRR